MSLDDQGKAGGGSLINISDLTRPASILMERVSDAIAGLARPWQIRRTAEAEAAAAIIHAEAEIEINALQRRALTRFVAEEAKRQENMESIAEQSVPLLSAGANPAAMESDWIAAFFENCRLVSDREMQQIWARILAGEANAPGVCSKRTLVVLSTMDRTLAGEFTRVANLCWDFPDQPTAVLQAYRSGRRRPDQLGFESLSNLESVGLLRFNTLGFQTQIEEGAPIVVRYGDRAFAIRTDPNTNPGAMHTGDVMLTRAGLDLVRMTDRTPVDGVADLVVGNWRGGYLSIEELPPA